MVGVARQKSPLEKAGEAARAALSKAKEAHEKNPNATTKAALDAASAKAKDATKAENRERFVKIGGARTTIAIAKLGALAKVANKRSYEFSEADIAKMVAAIEAELNGMREVFLASLKTGPKTAAVKNVFKFD